MPLPFAPKILDFQNFPPKNCLIFKFWRQKLIFKFWCQKYSRKIDFSCIFTYLVCLLNLKSIQESIRYRILLKSIRYFNVSNTFLSKVSVSVSSTIFPDYSVSVSNTLKKYRSLVWTKLLQKKRIFAHSEPTNSIFALKKIQN